MTKCAVVILNWNGAGYLKKFLPGLIDNTSIEGVELVVADNASSDNSLELLRSDFQSIRVIQLDKNYGFAGGYNKALEQVNAEYYMILNSDIELKNDWLPALLQFLDSNQDYSACMPSIRSYHKKEAYEYAGAAGGYIDRFGYAFCRGRLFNEIELHDPKLKEPKDVFWTTGACMLVRSDIFRKNKGFDEYFFAHMEEIDLCWRMKNQGYKLAIVPSSEVFHVGGGTLAKSNPYKTYLNFRNNLFLLYKNLPETGFKSAIRKRMIMDGLSGILFLISLQWKDLRAVLKAHRAFRKNKNRFEKFRNENPARELDEHPEIYMRSIVADYFLLGNKRFNQLRNGFPQKMNKNLND